MVASQLNQFLRELEQLLLLVSALPCQPADLVILAIGVVVSALRPCPFVTRADHRHALRKQKCGEQITPLPTAQFVDIGIIRRALGPVIPGMIIVVAVLIVLAVRFVVFVVIADEIVEREAIVRGDEIDARVRATAVVLVEIGTAGQAIS